jgi:hypothetical protein
VLAAFSLLAFAVVLALIALLGLKPWQADSVDPRLGPLGLEMAVGDSVALPSAPAAFVANATVAPGKAKLVSAPVGRHGGGGQSGGAPAVAPARAVAVSAAEPAPAQTPAPASPAPDAQPIVAPAPAPAAAPAPAPAAGPIAAAGENPPGSPSGPITSGGDEAEEACEGDEFVLTLSPLGEESSSGESPLKILLQHLNEDGSVDELELEGDLLDAQALLAELTAEGNCVEVELAPREPAEPAPPVSPVAP